MCRRTGSAAWLFVVPLWLSACSEADSAPDSPPADAVATAQVVEVTGLDYAFEAPAEIEAGWTTFHFANRGPEAHHLTLFRLEEGHTIEDVVAALRDRQPLQGIATAVGGPNAPMPGADANATLNLTPGEYALICLVPSPDGVPHVFKGMVRSLTVREGAPPAAETVAQPVPDLEITLQDYAFAVNGQIVAGPQTIRAVNATAATEPHEIVVARLAPGKSAEDVNDWIHAMEGPPPAEFLGGITALDPGHSGAFTVDFTPGEYALLCPLPSGDGQAHSYKGMMHEFTVQ